MPGARPATPRPRRPRRRPATLALRFALYLGACWGVLYTQLLLPFVAGAGLVGIALGAPFGAALAVGQLAAGGVLALAETFLLAGYLGSRRLVVRQLEAQVP